MTIDYTKLPWCIVTVNIGNVIGSFETGRFAIGHGAVNSLPLPAKVIRAASKLKPRLMRVFLQEYSEKGIDHEIVPGAGVLPPAGWIVD